MAARRVSAPVAGPNYTALPAAPLSPKQVTNLSVTTAASEHLVGADTTMVRLLVKGSIYISVNSSATASSQELSSLGAPGLYDTRGVTPGDIISLRSVTGTVSVQIVEF